MTPGELEMPTSMLLGCPGDGVNVRKVLHLREPPWADIDSDGLWVGWDA